MNIVRKIADETNDDDDYAASQADWESSILSFQGGLPNYYNGFVDEIEHLRLLIGKVGKLILEEEIAASKKRIQSNFAENSSDTEDAYYSTLPSLMFRKYSYKSFFLLANSLFENRLIELVHMIYTFKNINNNKLLNGTKLSYYIDDLENLLKIDLATYFPDRENYYEIRNAIQHRDGLTKKTHLMPWIQKKPGIEFKKTDNNIKVTLTNSVFIIEYLNLIEASLNEIVKKIKSIIYN